MIIFVSHDVKKIKQVLAYSIKDTVLGDHEIGFKFYTRSQRETGRFLL